MSVNINIVGIVPSTEKHKNYCDIYNKCKELGIDIPKEVKEYFENETPDYKGLFKSLDNYEAVHAYGSSKYNHDGLDVDLTKLPKDIKILRFYIYL